jgi:hypothetical protein
VGTKKFDHVTLTLVFDLLIVNFNLGLHLLNGIHEDFDISFEYSLRQDLFIGTKLFDLVTLTLVFNQLIENFNLGSIF